MTCANIQILIDESFLTGGIKLSPEVKNHVDSCADCLNYLHEMKALGGKLNLINPIELTEAEADRMMANLSEKIKPRRIAYRPNITSLIRSGLAAAAIIVISFLARPNNEQTAINFTIEQYWEELQLANLHSDDLSILLINGDDSDYLPSLIDSSEASFLTSQISGGQADEILDDINSEELEWLAQHYAMEM